MTSTLIWYRHHDLRVADHPALERARHDGPVVPVFIWAPEEEGDWPPGAASRWWLHHSLSALDRELASRGSRLILRRGGSLETLRELAKATGAERVHWNRRYEPAVIARDREIKRCLRGDGLQAESFNASLLREPWTVATSSGGPYQVFTPFWKACLREGPVPEPAPAPRELPSPSKWPLSLPLDELELRPSIDWAEGMREAWTPGERGAQRRLRAFVREGVDEYVERRNDIEADATSMISPHLRFGEVSPRQVCQAVLRNEHRGPDDPFLRQLYWREFAHHLLYHFPDTPARALREEFSSFPWRRNRHRLERWQRGATGYPIVDAAMRDLWARGWMPNRARMVVASLLTKHLLIPWQDGAAWFWDTLVDADLANNTLGWQWTAGCGADAAPFFRIFNPVSQAEKFDAEGDYVRRWVPELAGLPVPWIFRPWDAPPSVLEAAGVQLGERYPRPLVDHREGRAKALEAYQAMRSDGPG